MRFIWDILHDYEHHICAFFPCGIFMHLNLLKCLDIIIVIQYNLYHNNFDTKENQFSRLIDFL